MSNLSEVYSLVLEVAHTVHPERRARIFRGLADIIGDEQFAAYLVQRAEACEKLQETDGQLALDFKRRSAS